MTKKENLPAELESAFGDAVTLSEAAAIDGVLPQRQAAPRDEESARELVKWCGQNGVAFIPRGGGTTLPGPPVPPFGGE